MSMQKHIEKQKQQLVRCEKSLAQEKLKKRRADTRRKIELGGLVVKAGIDRYNKAVILGALSYTSQLSIDNFDYQVLFESKGNKLFRNVFK